MLPTLGIFLLAVLLATAAGLILETVLAPSQGIRLRPRTPAVGFTLVVVLLVAIGAAEPVARGVWWLLLVLAILGVLAVTLVHRRATSTRTPVTTWLRRERWRLLLLIPGLAIGVFALQPVLRLGFPTTIAASNNDGWSYSGISAWLMEHPWTHPAGSLTGDANALAADVFGQVVGMQLRDGFGIGFESYAAAIAVLTSYPTYAVVQATAAVLFVVAAAGWMDLGLQLRPALGHRYVVLLAIPALAPALMTIYSENYLPHAVGIALVPVALSALIEWFSTPSVSALVRSALGVAAILCVYPGILPWVLGPWVLLGAWALVRASRSRDTHGVSRAWAMTRPLIAPVILVTVFAPYQAYQSFVFLALKLGGAGVPYPPLSLTEKAAYLFGASGPSPVVGAPSAATVVALSLLVLVLGAGVLSLCLMSAKNVPVLLAALGTLLVSTVAIARFSTVPDFAYGIFKVLSNGGAFLAGFAMLGILLGSQRWSPMPFFIGAAVAATLWLQASANVLQASYAGSAGFRSADVTAGNRIANLPTNTVVLLEGTTSSAEAFHQRMAMAYMSQQYARRRVLGLGTTGSYMALSGTHLYRPDIPWNYVLANGAEATSPGRRALWSNGPYTLWSAPAIDSTPYGTNWYPVETTPEGVSFRWIRGAVELLVSNRTSERRTVSISMQVSAWRKPSVATLSTRRRLLARADVPTSELVPLRANVQIPPRSVQTVVVRGGPPRPGPAADKRMLSLRLQGLSIRAARP